MFAYFLLLSHIDLPMIIPHKNRTVNVSPAKSECQLGCLLSRSYIYKGIKIKITETLDIVFLYMSNI